MIFQQLVMQVYTYYIYIYNLNYKAFFRKNNNPMILIGCKLKREVIIINFTKMLQIIKYDLAPNCKI
jgi:hypothetical protein